MDTCFQLFILSTSARKRKCNLPRAQRPAPSRGPTPARVSDDRRPRGVAVAPSWTSSPTTRRCGLRRPHRVPPTPVRARDALAAYYAAHGPARSRPVGVGVPDDPNVRPPPTSPRSAGPRPGAGCSRGILCGTRLSPAATRRGRRPRRPFPSSIASPTTFLQSPSRGGAPPPPGVR